MGVAILVGAGIFSAYAVFVQFPQPGCKWGTEYPVGGAHPGGTLTGYICPSVIAVTIISQSQTTTKQAVGTSLTPTMPTTTEPYLSYGIIALLIGAASAAAGFLTPHKGIVTRRG